MVKTTVAAIAIAAAIMAAPALARGRVARCDVVSADGRYAGPCVFTPGGKGAFAISLAGSRRIIRGIKLINVYPTGGGQAEVRGLTDDGINSRWGTATRSRTNRACWIGEDFKVCAT